MRNEQTPLLGTFDGVRNADQGISKAADPIRKVIVWFSELLLQGTSGLG